MLNIDWFTKLCQHFAFVSMPSNAVRCNKTKPAHICLVTNKQISLGQTIMHCHIHLIPRREGDVENPQGGVRSVIQKNQHYKRK